MISSPPAVGDQIQIFQDPSQGGDILKFGDGEQGGHGAIYYPTLPPIPGTLSQWQLVEWKKAQYLDPTLVSYNNPNTYNNFYGIAPYYWSTPDGSSAFAIYDQPSGSGLAFGLNSSGGIRNPNGGTDVFLQSEYSGSSVNFGSPITVNLDAQVTQAELSYNSVYAQQNQLVSAHFDIGFSVWFNNPTSAFYDNKLPSFQSDLDIIISMSQNSPSGPYLMATPNRFGGADLIYGNTLPGDQTLAFSSAQNPTALTYNLNHYLQDMITQPWAVQDGSGSVTYHWLPEITKNMSLWTLSSVGIGLETAAGTAAPGTSNLEPQGSVSAGIIISNISITDNTNQIYNPSSFSDPVRLPGSKQVLPWQTTIVSNGVTSLVQVANQYALDSSGGSGPFLSYQGSPVTVGEFGAASPIGAARTASGYEVAWKVAGADQYVIWNTDSNGNYTSTVTGLLTGQSYALQAFETSFNEDLNGDGRLSTVLDTTTTTGNILNLAGQTQNTAIDIGSNTASVSTGLNAPSLTFIGTPDTIILGSSADTIDYAMAPTSGIETIANFNFGLDELNIDMMGAAYSSLEAYDTTVYGTHAIAIFSKEDLFHGLVMLNIPTSQTSSSVLENNTTFLGGHAIIR